MAGKPVEIVCSECGQDTLIRREPVYDGFTRVGEKCICTSCKHEFADEADVPFKDKKTSSIFSDEDRTKVVDVFGDEEKGRNCRHCQHYVVNPFIQRCGLHHREVAATDQCDDFDRLDEAEEKGGE